MTTRRALLELALGASLISLVGRAQAVSGSLAREGEWISSVEELSAGVRGQTLSVADWRAGLDALFRRIPLNDLLTQIDFEQLSRQVEFASIGVTALNLPTGQRLSFFPKLFAVGPGRAIIPHGHANMVSAHLTLQGRFHLRQYDQISLADDHMTVRPTRDEMIGPGAISSISEDSDNVHWFIADGPAYTLDVIMTGLDEHQPDHQIYNLDMELARPVGGDTWRVPRLGVSEALAKYG